jgi:small subunit ribosomal protein S3
VGQKTHPKGFRLITTEKHLSNWYSKKSIYPSLIEEDFLIRLKSEELFKEFLSISKIEITRTAQQEKQQDENQKEYVNISINALFPRAKEMYRKVPKYFLEKIEKPTQKTISILNNPKGSLKRFTGLLLKQTIRNLIRFLQMKTNKFYSVGIKFVKNPFEDATLIAKFIADQLEKRIPFRRAVKQTIKKVQLTTMKGIKVQVSGRLNGIDIARSEWKRDGKVPLHTLRAKIDYTHQRAQTVYGVIGIKVWLFVK